MNRLMKSFAALAIVATALAGCSKDTALQNTTNTPVDWANIKWEVTAPHADAGTPDTRALKLDWATGDRIAVYFDHDVTKFVTLVYEDFGWRPIDPEPLDLSYGQTGKVQAFHAGSLHLEAGSDIITGVHGDMLYDDGGSFIVGYNNRVYLTLNMQRGATTAIKVVVEDTQELPFNGWRLAGENILIPNATANIETSELMNAEHNIVFGPAIEARFAPSNGTSTTDGRWAWPDEVFTKNVHNPEHNIAVFHVIAPEGVTKTTFYLYNTEDPEKKIYTRTYNATMQKGETVLLHGPDSGEANEWNDGTITLNSVPNRTYEGTNGDRSMFNLTFLSHNEIHGGEEWEMKVFMVSEAIDIEADGAIFLPEGTYNVATEVIPPQWTANVSVTKGNGYGAFNHEDRRAATSGTITVTKLNPGMYNLIADLTLEGGGKWRGTYTGPIIFEPEPEPDNTLTEVVVFAVSDPGGNKLVAMTPDGTVKKIVYNAAGAEYDFCRIALHPEGKKAVVMDDKYNMYIYDMIEKTVLKILDGPEYHPDEAVWHPNGETILFTGLVDGIYRATSIKPDGTETILTSEEWDLYRANYTPDGTKIIAREDANYPIGRSYIATFDANGSNPAKILEAAPGIEFDCPWPVSNDRIFYFHIDEDWITSLCTVGIDGSNPETLETISVKWEFADYLCTNADGTLITYKLMGNEQLFVIRELNGTELGETVFSSDATNYIRFKFGFMASEIFDSLPTFTD